MFQPPALSSVLAQPGGEDTCEETLKHVFHLLLPQMWPWLGRVFRKPKRWYVWFGEHLLSHTFVAFSQLPVHHLPFPGNGVI